MREEVIRIWMVLIRLVVMKIQCHDCSSEDDGRDDGDHVSDDESGDDEGVAVLAMTVMMMAGVVMMVSMVLL